MFELLREKPLGFMLHVVIEVPAAINFFLFPSGQLDSYSPQAHAVIRQYAMLLLTSVLIAMVFLVRPVDQVSGQIAGALSIYHVAPCLRSIGRLYTRFQQDESLFASQANFYVLLHSFAGASLAACCWSTFLKTTGS